MRFMRRVAALVAVLAVLAAGCGGDDGDDASSDTTATTTASSTTTAAPTTTSTTVPLTTTTLAPEEEVLAAYRNAWEQQRLASDPPDPNHPGFLATHAEPARSRLIADLMARAQSGTAFRGTLTLHPRVESMGDGTAVIVDCIHEEGVDVHLESGRMFNPVNESIETWNTMILEDGAWKRSNQRSGEPCVP